MPAPYLQDRCSAVVRRYVMRSRQSWTGTLEFDTREDQCARPGGHTGYHETVDRTVFRSDQADVSEVRGSSCGFQNVCSDNVTASQQGPERVADAAPARHSHLTSTNQLRMESEMNTCTRCGARKSVDEFRWMPSRGAWHSWCRECERAHRRSAPRRTATSRRRNVGRAFGVEIELTGPSRDIILGALRGIGINANSTGYRATNGSQWELKADCSVNGYGLELVSPKLYGQAGIETLERVLAAINSVGASVDRSCGIHVHVDFRNRTADQIKDAIRPILRSQSAFFEMVAPSRRTNHYSAPWSESQMTAFDNTNDIRYLMNTGPRGFVNLGSFTRHGSIEFRSHGASTNFTKISAWIALLFKAVEFGETNGRHAQLGDTALEVLDTLEIRGAHAAALLRFVNAAELVEANDYAQAGV